MTVRSDRSRPRGRSLFGITLLFIGGWISLRIIYVSPFIASYDIANFTLAVTDYDLADLRPHFPGYPFFILLANVFLPVTTAVKSLGLVSTLGLASALLPLYLLFRRHAYDKTRLIAAFTVLSTASLVTFAATGMSDGLALGLLIWYGWSIERARHQIRRWLPYLLFGLLMATRLSYAPFGFMLLILLWQVRKDYWQLLSECALLLLAQLAWLLPVAFSVGGPYSFLQLSLRFVSGHFSDWGGSAQTDDASIFKRFIKTLQQLFWHGIGYGTWIGLVSGMMLFLRKRWTIDLAWGTTAGLYFIWVWVGQNIDKPRHVLPLVLLLLVWSIRQVPLRMYLPFLVVQLTIGSLALNEQATRPPATIELARYVTTLSPGATVFTDEEARQFESERPDASIVPIGSVSKWNAEPKSDQSYVTGRLLERLHAQGVRPKVKQVVRFTSDSRYEPEDAQAMLYQLIAP